MSEEKKKRRSDAGRPPEIPNPARTIVISFLLAILAGAGLLLLPVSTVRGGGLATVDALFTATSAVCVTGLTVVDTGSTFTRFGQAVLAVLIQSGGLGIVTFSVFFLSILGKRPTLIDRLIFRTMSERFGGASFLRLFVTILLVTFLIEGIGAALLYLRFRETLVPADAVFAAVFHAISAFCNAGFSLFRDSLMGFQREFWVPGIVMVLIVLGGIGFSIVTEGLEKITGWIFRRRTVRISLHTKAVLVMTAVLIPCGTLVIWMLERRNSLAGLPLPLQIWNALFQSITPRTAGFNTIPIGTLTEPALLFITMLMFIGGAPASTAGGIKVSTVAVLLALVFSEAGGRSSPSLFKRKIPGDIIARALTIFAAAFVFVNVMAFLILISEHRALPHGAVTGRFLDLFFEVVSAFGTVGLSAGATPTLTVWGKLLIIFTMIVGRVGPLTLALAVVAKRREQAHYEYAEEEVMVG